MIGQAAGHGWREQHLSAFALSKGFSPAQLMMRPAEVVGTSQQPHAVFQRSQSSGCMAAFACQTGEELSHGPVQALDKGGIERRSCVGSRKQCLRLFQRSLNQLARDYYHAFLSVRLITTAIHTCGHTRKLARPRPTVSLTFSRNARRILPG